jgi:outer membrane protein TolC
MAVSAGAAEGPAPVTDTGLDSCVQAALVNSPDLRAAGHRVSAAAAGSQEAGSAWYPQVSVAGNWARTDNPPQAFFMDLNQRQASLQKDFNQPDDTENYRGSVVAKALLFDGGQRASSHRMAKENLALAGASRDALRNEVVHAVARGYYGARQARAHMKVQEEALQSLAESVRVAEERRKAGAALEADILSLQVRMAQAQQDFVRATNGFVLAVASLNAVIGKDWVTVESLAGGEPATTPSPPPATEAGNASIEHRPELEAARRAARIQEAAVRKAQAEYLPSVSAFGSVDWDSDRLKDWQDSYLVGAVMQWDLFTGFRRGAAVTGARERLAEAQAQEEQAHRQLSLDLTQARLQMDELWTRLGVAEKGQQAAAEALRLTKARYLQGAADLGELLNAQLSLTAMQSSRVSAHYDYLLARVNWDRARGELVRYPVAPHRQ